MPTSADLLFGQIAVKNGLISEEQLRECLHAQALSLEVGYEESLPAILLKKGYLDREKIGKVERAQALAQFIKAEKLYARLLVERGVLSADEARALLDAQRKDGFRRSLGILLLESGRVSQEQHEAIADVQMRALVEDSARAVEQIVRPRAAAPDPADLTATAPAMSAVAAVSAPAPPAGGGGEGDDGREDVALDEDGSVHLRIGEQLVRDRVITPEQLADALHVQTELRRRGVSKRIGDVLADRRYLSAEQAKRVTGALKRSQLAQELVGGYELIGRLGQGALGVVYKARRKFEDSNVALKILPPSFSATAGLVARFRGAWERAKGLDHPGIVRLLEFSATKDLSYYTMEFVEGQTLSALVGESGPLPEREALALVRGVAQALDYAHARGVHHRDLRPENVLVLPDGSTKIGDVGLGRVLERLSATGVATAGSDPGEDPWAAPEELVARGPTPGAESDIYSLGHITAFALTGRAPTSEERERPLDLVGRGVALSPRFSAILERMTAPDPVERYASVADLLEDLERVGQETEPIHVSSIGLRPPSSERPAAGDDEFSIKAEDLGIVMPSRREPSRPADAPAAAAAASRTPPQPSVRPGYAPLAEGLSASGRRRAVIQGPASDGPVGEGDTTRPIPMPEFARAPKAPRGAPAPPRPAAASPTSAAGASAGSEEGTVVLESSQLAARTRERARPSALPPAPVPPPVASEVGTVILDAGALQMPTPAMPAPAAAREGRRPGPPAPTEAQPPPPVTEAGTVILDESPLAARGRKAASAPPPPAAVPATESGTVILDAPEPAKAATAQSDTGFDLPSPARPAASTTGDTVAMQRPSELAPRPAPGSTQALPRPPDLRHAAVPGATQAIPRPPNLRHAGAAAPPAPTAVPEPSSQPAPAAEPEPAKPAEPDDPLVGKVLTERYLILKRLGAGGMGVVYKAQHTIMDRVLAFKVLNPSLLSSPESVGRFKREIKAAARFRHNNIVQIFDAGQAEGNVFYMAMEFVEGRELTEILRASGALPAERAVHIMRQALRAVSAAHKAGIIHRDLKSDNLMISRGAAGEDVVKIMDFGIAKMFDPEDGTKKDDAAATPASAEAEQMISMHGEIVGTPQYMSPEQATAQKLDHRTDIYSISVIFYEMLAGCLPFESETATGFIGKHVVEPPKPLAEMRPDLKIDPRLDAVVLRGLAKDRNKRYQSADEMLAEIESALEAAPAPPPGGESESTVAVRQLQKPSGFAGFLGSRASLVLLTVLVLVLAALVIVLSLGIVPWGRSRPGSGGGNERPHETGYPLPVEPAVCLN